MPILMQMFWDGIKTEQYEKLHKESNYETDTPKGAIFHSAAFDKTGMHVVDLWETEKDFNNFVEKRLMPTVDKMGIKKRPEVKVYTIHSSFVPGFEKIKSKSKQMT